MSQAQGSATHFKNFSFIDFDRQLISDLFELARTMGNAEPFRFFVPVFERKSNAGKTVGGIAFETGEPTMQGESGVRLKLPANFEPPESIDLIVLRYFSNNPQIWLQLGKKTQQQIKDFLDLVAQFRNEVAGAQNRNPNPNVPQINNDAKIADISIDFKDKVNIYTEPHFDQQPGTKISISNIPTVFYDPVIRNIPLTDRKFRLKTGKKSPKPYQLALFDPGVTIHSWPRVKNQYRETILMRTVNPTGITRAF